MSNLDYVSLEPRSDMPNISRGRTVLITDRDGQVCQGEHGLWVYQTRLLSRYRYRVAGAVPERVTNSRIQQYSWLGYYYRQAPWRDEPWHHLDASTETLELRVTRQLRGGMHEDLTFTNFTQKTVSFVFEIEMAADFADLDQVGQGKIALRGPEENVQTVEWRDGELLFRHRASRRYEQQSETGERKLDRSLTVRVEKADSEARYHHGILSFDIELEAAQTWHACLSFTPCIDGYDMGAAPCWMEPEPEPESRFRDDATDFEHPAEDDLTYVVLTALTQAERDLEALRLEDRDQEDRLMVPAAGVPLYVGLFGRDSLTAAWQAALASPDFMGPTLNRLVSYQGTEDNEWRDERPGRMLHEAHTGPWNALAFEPRDRYYGSLTTSSFFPVVLAELWHWTGDRSTVENLIEPALRCLESLDRYARREDGFYYYDTRSRHGLKNQAWKDSPDAIVYPDGKQVSNPIAACEEQGFVYSAKVMLSEVLWWFDRRDHARDLYREAAEFKERFQAAFWLDDEQFVALGLDPEGNPVKTITSNAGHLLASGILDGEQARAVADRLLSEELFSGWGVRTLSNRHPAYNPYSYHRGSVWPVEQATFSLGFFRYGLHEHLEKLTRAQFDASSLFKFHRFPEVLAGHPRDKEHPFPGLYPRTNFPQAWSASALFLHLQSMLGIYPYAPMKLLLLDPHLPPWLPEITLKKLRVGDGRVSLRFFRRDDGKTDYQVEEKEGSLHVLRQPSPWSLTAGPAERIKDALMSLLPSR